MGLTPRLCEDLFKKIELANTTESSTDSSSSTLCFKTLIRYYNICLFLFKILCLKA